MGPITGLTTLTFEAVGVGLLQVLCGNLSADKSILCNDISQQRDVVCDASDHILIKR